MFVRLFTVEIIERCSLTYVLCCDTIVRREIFPDINPVFLREVYQIVIVFLSLVYELCFLDFSNLLTFIPSQSQHSRG